MTDYGIGMEPEDSHLPGSGWKHSADVPLVLCVDAGGTSCKAAIISADGKVASSVGGPCNV